MSRKQWTPSAGSRALGADGPGATCACPPTLGCAVSLWPSSTFLTAELWLRGTRPPVREDVQACRVTTAGRSLAERDTLPRGKAPLAAP